MQKIDNIEIKNFKSIRHQKIEGCKRINVFIGYPNAGKSNILEALSLFSIDRPNANFDSFVRMGRLTTLYFNGNVNENIEIRINNENRIISTLQESNKIGFDWQLTGADASFDKMGPGVQQMIYGMLNFIKSEDENKISNWNSIFKRLPLSDNFFKEFGDRFLAAIKKYQFEKNVISTSGKYDSLAVPNGENIFDIIETHPDLKKEVADLFEIYDLKLLYNSTDKEFNILKFLSRNTIFTIPFKLVADTLRHLIFYKAAIASNKDSILLFEEPEAHMFPPYISKFTGSVWESNSNQFFITTHSPYVINDFLENCKDELNIYLVNYQDGETKILKLSNENLDTIYNMGTESVFYNLEKFSIDENTVHA
jgi:AAA15 family ATPase/GTPase